MKGSLNTVNNIIRLERRTLPLRFIQYLWELLLKSLLRAIPDCYFPTLITPVSFTHLFPMHLFSNSWKHQKTLLDYCVTDICIWQTKKKRTVLSNICRSVFCLTKTTTVVTWQDEYFEEIIILNSLTTKKQICKAWLTLMKLLFFVPFTFMQLNLICSSWTVFY